MGSRTALKSLVVATVLPLAGCAARAPAAESAAPAAESTVAGPPHGTLVIAGGGALGPDVMGRFIELAGGPDARIVVIPTAGTRDDFGDDWSGLRAFRDAGVGTVTVLNTRDPLVADRDEFVRPLREATGVWMPGGRQWRLADAYLGTRTLRELHAVLERGGVIGGTSAGASIQSDYMVRGAVEGNTIMMAPGHEEGFGFLRGAAVDQHLLARGRQDDLLEVMERHPHLLGIGIDEGTAVVVHGDRAEVVGASRVAFYNTADADGVPYYFLRAGDVFDLAARRTITGERVAPAVVLDERAVIAAMDALFDAMRDQDTTAMRTLLHPQLQLFVPGGSADAPTLRVSTADQFIQAIAASADRLDERAFAPEVRIDGNLASVWTYYEFRSGDAFSHCGTDAFHFVRTIAGWQIVGLAYTVQREGCPARDLL